VRAFRIDPNRTEPRAALGHVVIGGRGYSPAEAKLVPPTVSVTKDRTPSELARALGLQLLAYRAGRFMFESRGAEHQFRLVLESAVRADGLVSFLLKGDAGSVVPMPLNTHALGGAESFELYLRRANLPAAQAAVARSTGLHSTYAAQVTSAGLAGNAPYMADWLVHGVVIQSCVGPNPQGQAWLKVGLSDYVSERVVGTMQTRLFVVEESSGVNLMAERPGAEVWRIRIRNRALLEDDPKAGILFSSAFTGMSLEDAMKSWSLVAYLVERDVAKFREFARTALASDSIRALKRVYDLEPEGLDAAWRSWVIDHG